MKLIPRTRRGRLLAGALLLIVMALVGWWLLKPPPMPTLATSPVTKGDIEQTVEATGTIKPSQLVSVGAQVSGRIEVLKVKLGDEVKAGDLIAEIDSRTQLNTLESAQASLKNARANRQVQVANLRQYELAFKRQETMLAAQATSQADYDTARAQLESTKAQIAALDATITSQETTVATAQTNLGYTKITAPIDGTVVAVVSKQGQTVNANQSAPTIVMLGNLDTMTVYADISEADVVKAKEGQAAYFTILGNADKRYATSLRDIAPAPDSVTSEDSTSSSSSSSSSSTSSTAIYYNGLLDVANTDRSLRTYMTAQVSIVLGKASDVLLIPSAALGDKGRDGGYLVQVVGADGRPQPRKVVIGLNNNANAEVKSGLREGERVVVGEVTSATQAASAAASANRQQRRGPGGPPPIM
ncbi:membrane fusion protein, macrolide-specific efflux system [Pseudoxanthomonas sp. GM95]|uniref:efflux RND transporter periplasmic adaptor subunit n=1 Tax=Pseudoxanthomonas sp. GM95 TaxID=1881043 RepID=UPI0008BFE982|nr:efflux RND transporter periplasmic adaptor subunit [Pseudoxanthomonas sp. GM95]SEM37715.1 membrane fusion protein, macrolide-specific efflux system [Pseudoxanthomonas sp. GM95]